MTAYTPTTWVDEIPASSPVKYKITDDTGGVIANSAKIETVTEITAGTAVNAANLNKLESGVAAAQTAADTAVVAAATAQAKADAAIPKNLVTAAGDLIYATAGSSLNKLAKPTMDSVLKMTSSGIPSWYPIVRFPKLQGFSQPLTNSNWNGVSKAVGTYSIEATSFNSGIPGTATALLMHIVASWSSASDGNMMIVRPYASSGNYLMIRSLIANRYNDAQGIVTMPIGFFDVEIAGAGATGVWIDVVGYYEG